MTYNGYKILNNDHKKSSSNFEELLYFAVWTGLEPATPCVTGMYSNQLNYQTKIITTFCCFNTGLFLKGDAKVILFEKIARAKRKKITILQILFTDLFPFHRIKYRTILKNRWFTIGFRISAMDFSGFELNLSSPHI